MAEKSKETEKIKALEREISLIKHENAKLRRENEYLSHRIELLSPKEKKDVPHEEELFLKTDDIDNSRGYMGYILRKFKLSFVYRVYDRTFFAIRKYLFASKLWKNFLIILAIFGTSVQALLTFGSVLVIVPTTLVIVSLFALLSYFTHKKLKKNLLSAANGKKLYFLYANKKRSTDGVFYKTVKELSENGCVFVVSSSLSLCGFSFAKKRAENVYFIHTSFYFTFMKAAERADAPRVIKIY